MPATSIKEVARQAGVSIATVSNVLNRPHLVAAATRERVQAAIGDLGYVRSEVARQLRAGRSRTVALVVLDVANPFFTDVARGAERLAAEHGLMVVLSDSDGDAVQEERNLDQLEQLRVLGMVIAPLRYDNPQLDRLTERGIPVVLLGPGASARGAHCSVEIDNVLGGRLAGMHLLERGHRHIAFVGGPQVEDRHTGLRQALNSRARVTRISPPALSTDGGRTAGEELARLPPGKRPTAVFCANDLAALGVLQEMTRHGIGVPTEMAIVGFDDIQFAAAAAVPLTSVRQPRELLGRAAVELLLEKVTQKDQHTHRRVMFRPDLVVREST